MTKETTPKKDLAYYLALPWTFIYFEDTEDGGYVAKVEELKGCLSQGDTIEEAKEMIREALAMWLDVAIRHGDPIPEPGTKHQYSGKFNLRTPAKLHKALAEAAEEDGVSLNLFVVSTLATAIGRRDLVEPKQKPVAKAPVHTTEHFLPKGIYEKYLSAFSWSLDAFTTIDLTKIESFSRGVEDVQKHRVTGAVDIDRYRRERDERQRQ